MAIAAGRPAFFWTWPAILLGLLLGATSLRTLRWSLLFPCVPLLLTAQLLLWDRAPAMVRLTASPFAVTVLLLAPVAAILGAIFPRLLDRAPGPAGHLLAAHALGCAAGWLLAMFVLAPLAGSEVSLKLLALVLAGLWVFLVLRGPVTRPRLAITAAVIMVLLAVVFGQRWNWGLLTAGP